MIRRLHCLGVVLTCFATCSDAIAQVSFPNYPQPDLPRLATCAHPTPTTLPEKWKAISLMSPYGFDSRFPAGAELRVGRFVYDASVGAFRAGAYRVGSTKNLVDLLITDDRTWVLAGEWDNPKCVAQWGENYPLPGRVWQDRQAICVGNHRTAPAIHTGPKVDWWKQPSPVKATGADGEAGDWFWFDRNGHPTRTFFWAKHSGLPAVLSEYAYSNFYRFQPVQKTSLKALVAICESAKSLPVFDEDQRIAHRSVAQRPSAGYQNTLAELIPGLSYEACADSNREPPGWPEQTYLTAFSTAAKFSVPQPLRTAVYYDPAGPDLRTRVHKHEVDPSTKRSVQVFSDAVLLAHDSYGVDFLAKAPYTQLLGCRAGPHTSMPGALHPDWGARGGCQCMAVIDNNSVLSPNRKTQISSCPLSDGSGNTLLWMWYAVTQPQEPILMFQTRANVTIGTGLAMTDYYAWQAPPTTLISAQIFTAPGGCQSPPSAAPTPPAACLYCHLPSTNSGQAYR